MYSDSEIESAIAAGTLTREAADGLRHHVERQRAAPMADEEQFRLVTSFNDIFVAIAGILVLVGAGWIGSAVWPPLAGLLVAAASWAMAEYFTRVRRMAFPSIVFFISFVGGVYFFCTFLFARIVGDNLLAGQAGKSILLGQVVAAALVVGASWLHWRRFMVPISIALGVASIARFAYTLVAWAAYPNIGQWILLIVLAGGLAVFAYAMRWDIADRERQTRKADVAFWLHLVASPMIVHPIFMLIGLNLLGIGGFMRFSDAAFRQEPTAAMGATIALAAIVIYALLALVALVIDRRAILVSALVYVLGAAIYLAWAFGAKGAGFAVAVIVIGSGLLMLSAFWQAMRRRALPLLPERWSTLMPLPSAA